MTADAEVRDGSPGREQRVTGDDRPHPETGEARSQQPNGLKARMPGQAKHQAGNIDPIGVTWRQEVHVGE